MARNSRASALVLEALSDGRIRSLREMRDLGASPQTLRRMVDDGRISSPGLGLYQSADAAFDEREQFAAVSRAVPSSIVWLLSAAALHRITQVMPADIWIAVPGTHRGSVEMGMTSIRATRLSRARDLEIGIDTVTVHGVDVRVTNPARTVVDLWRYSTFNESIQSQFRKIDDESFLDALANYLSPDRFNGSMDDLVEMADAFGVLRGMQAQLKTVNHRPFMIP
jgi:predicted transcriptional regulator of viral defense system